MFRFESSGDSLSIDSSDACEIQQVPFDHSLLLELASSMLSYGAVVIFELIGSRNFTYRADLSDDQRRRLLLRYSLLDKLSAVLGHAYTIFVLWYVALFLRK